MNPEENRPQGLTPVPSSSPAPTGPQDISSTLNNPQASAPVGVPTQPKQVEAQPVTSAQAEASVTPPTATKTPEMTQPESAQQASAQPVSQPQATAQPQQKPVEGKKSKAWIIILIIILLLLALLFGAIYWTTTKISGAASTFFSKVEDELGVDVDGGNNGGEVTKTTTAPANNPIIDANNKMRNELGSFDYKATITSNAMDMDIETVMNCTFDGKNKLEYCNTELFMGMGQEIYYDWGNGYEYTKTTSPYSFAPVDEGWTKTSIPSGTTGGIDIGNGTSFSDLKSESVTGGTKYTGSISGFTAADVDTGSLNTNTTMNFEIIVNGDGYIETITMDMDASGMSQNVVVEYSNFGTAKSLSIPEEAK